MSFKVGDKVILKGTSFISSFVENSKVFTVIAIEDKDVDYKSTDGYVQYGYIEDSSLYHKGYEVELVSEEPSVSETATFKAGDLVIALQTIPGNEIVKDTLYEVKAVDSFGYLCINLAQLDAMVGVPPEYFESYSETVQEEFDRNALDFNQLMKASREAVEKAASETAGHFEDEVFTASLSGTYVVEEGDVRFSSASERQTGDPRSYNVGSSNYADFSIQPWDIWREYDLNPWDADIIKRTLRTKKGEERVLDYEKIIHICKERIRQIND